MTKKYNFLHLLNRKTMNSEVPYNTLPPLPGSGALFTLDQKNSLKCGNARAALAELKGAINTIPNPAVLINSIPLLETHSSNKIENIVTTQDDLFRFSSGLDHLADPATKEALRYRTALKEAQNQLINTKLVVKICSIIKDKIMRPRTKKVHIVNRSTGKAIYTPPDNPNTIKKLLKNWTQFTQKKDIDPLIQMAVLHYQFEAIHPFMDGNGRTGRILNLLFLVQKELLRSPILYLSRYILEHRSEYYRLLTQVTEHQDWNTWISYILDAIENTSIWTLNRIQTIIKFMEHTDDYLKKTLKPSYYKGMLMELLFTYPYCRSINLQKLGIKSPITSRKYLRKLVNLKILTEEKQGKEILFIHKKYLNLLMSSDHQFTEYD